MCKFQFWRHASLVVLLLILFTACDQGVGNDPVVLPEVKPLDACASITVSRYTFQAKPWPADKAPPLTMEASIAALDAHLDDQQKTLLQCLPVKRAEVHIGLALWMRNEWRLYDVSPLKDALRALGVVHPDGVSNVIAWRYIGKLRGQENAFEKELVRYREQSDE